MEDHNEFSKLLRQIINQECKPLLSREEIEESIREMEVIKLMGDHVVW